MYDGDDRTKQIDALQDLASDICRSIPEDTRPDDIDSEALRLWYMPEEMPGWFGDSDMELLIQMVRRECGD